LSDLSGNTSSMTTLGNNHGAYNLRRRAWPHHSCLLCLQGQSAGAASVSLAITRRNSTVAHHFVQASCYPACYSPHFQHLTFRTSTRLRLRWDVRSHQAAAAAVPTQCPSFHYTSIYERSAQWSVYSRVDKYVFILPERVLMTLVA